jgi:hypothetical protein
MPSGRFALYDLGILFTILFMQVTSPVPLDAGSPFADVIGAVRRFTT